MNAILGHRSPTPVSIRGNGSQTLDPAAFRSQIKIFLKCDAPIVMLQIIVDALQVRQNIVTSYPNQIWLTVHHENRNK